MTSMVMMVLKRIAMFGGLQYGEQLVLNTLAESEDVPLNLATEATISVPKLYGAVILCNVVASSITLVSLGMKVGQARKKYDVKLPTMYSNGTKDSDIKFNCIQRGHAQALETFQSFLAMSLIGGIRHPLVTASMGIVYCVSRLKWAEGYATGDPDARYSYSAWGKHTWTALIGVLCTSISTACGIMGLF